VAVHAILVREGGQVWLGTPRGLQVVGPETGTKALPVGRASAELVEAPVSGIVPGPDGTLWVGTGKEGLARVARGGAPTLEAVPGLPLKGIEAVLPLPGGRLLVSVADTGLYEGTPGSFSRVGDDQVPGRPVRAFTAARPERTPSGSRRWAEGLFAGTGNSSRSAPARG
jgi:hypothetical protein